MRKLVWVCVGVLALALLVSPALARPGVISDTFDPETGTGVAVVELGDGSYAKILYRDSDRSGSFTSGDARIRVVYLLRPRPLI